MTTFLQKLQARNLPITSANDVTLDFVRTREFTDEEVVLLNEAILEHSQPTVYQKKVDDALRIDNLSSFLVSSGLAGMDIADVNSNADRDNLLKAICFQIGLCDSGGIIYSTAQVPQANNENSTLNIE